MKIKYKVYISSFVIPVILALILVLAGALTIDKISKDQFKDHLHVETKGLVESIKVEYDVLVQSGVESLKNYNDNAKKYIIKRMDSNDFHLLGDYFIIRKEQVIHTSSEFSKSFMSTLKTKLKNGERGRFEIKVDGEKYYIQYD
jgi:hypothetical protein